MSGKQEERGVKGNALQGRVRACRKASSKLHELQSTFGNECELSDEGKELQC